jgi:polysaccharide export outer membrane protein
MNSRLIPICLMILVMGWGCSTKDLRVQEYRVTSDTPNPAKPPEEFYLISAGDALNINVWKEPSLGGSVKVRPDGFITLPLLNYNGPRGSSHRLSFGL